MDEDDDIADEDGSGSGANPNGTQASSWEENYLQNFDGKLNYSSKREGTARDIES